MKPTRIEPGQVWIWRAPERKIGEAKELVVDRVTIPIPDNGLTTIQVACIQAGVSSDGANLVHFREYLGKTADAVMLQSREWTYVRG